MRSILKGFILLLTVTGTSLSQTSVSPGDVSGTWMSAGSPYLVQGDITVPSDSTLVIEPGVAVVFQGHYALNVQGRLLAIGTAADSISFTVSDTTGFSNIDSVQGGWYGIRLIDTPPTNDSTILAYCRLEYGKAIGPDYPSNTGGAISIANFSKVRISNCLVAHSVAGGSYLPGGGGIGLTGASAVLEANLIADNLSTGQGGGLLVNGSKVWSTQNRYIFNMTSGQGGAVLIEGGSTLEFQSDIIAYNTSSSSGGGIFAYGQPQISMEGVSFIANAASWGGGIAVFSCSLSVNKCMFESNTATTEGGAIGASLSSLDISGNMFAQNKSGSDGGAICGYHSDLRLRSSFVTSNRAGKDSLTGTGGAIYTEMGSLHIDSCSFQRDTAWMAAGIRVYNGDFVADSVIIEDHCAFNIESGLYWSADSAYFGRPYIFSLKRVKFLHNTAKNNFAAYIYQPASGPSLADFLIDQCEFTENSAYITPALGLSGTFKDLVISNTSFLRNVAGSRTAGLSFAGGAQGRVFNCLFAGNSCAGSPSVGAGLSMGASSDVDVVNCTFAFNSAASGSALSVRGGTKARVTNTVFWKNTGAYIAVATLTGAGAHATVNFCNLQHGQDSITVSDPLSSFVWGSGNRDGDPLFVDSLGTDFHLSMGSHCIGAGVDSVEVDSVWQWAPLTDIEGLPRPRPLGTHPDMGAFEDQFSVPVGVALRNSGDGPLKFGLDQNYPNPFNPTTKIQFTIANRQLTIVKVFDLVGREVATVVNEVKDPGSYTVQFDGSNLASGVYFYRLETGNFVQTRKLVVLR